MFICSRDYLLAEECMKAHSPSSSMLANVALSSFSVASFPVTEHCFPDRYTMFWVLLLATKLTVSFYIEVKIHFFHLVYLPLSVDGSFGTFLPSCAIIIIIKEQNKFKCPTAWTMIFLKFILLWI